MLVVFESGEPLGERHGRARSWSLDDGPVTIVCRNIRDAAWPRGRAGGGRGGGIGERRGVVRVPEVGGWADNQSIKINGDSGGIVDNGAF
jgi:hypothetical protein